jgi:hypothetical protein
MATHLARDERARDQIVRPHRGGSGLRLHVSNRFGQDALGIGEIRLAGHLGGGEIDPATDVAVATDGNGTVKIPRAELSRPIRPPCGFPTTQSWLSACSSRHPAGRPPIITRHLRPAT